MHWMAMIALLPGRSHLQYLIACSMKYSWQLLEVAPSNTTKFMYSRFMYKPSQSCYKLNSFICRGLNRTGQLCGKGEDGLGPAIFSYDQKCLECLPACLVDICLGCIFYYSLVFHYSHFPITSNNSIQLVFLHLSLLTIHSYSGTTF